MFSSLCILFRTAPLPWLLFLLPSILFETCIQSLFRSLLFHLSRCFPNNEAKLVCLYLLWVFCKCILPSLLLELLLLFPGETNLVISNLLQNNIYDSWFPFFSFCIKQTRSHFKISALLTYFDMLLSYVVYLQKEEI